MAIKVETQQYVAVHGKAPRGAGSWAFVREASHGMPAHTFFSPAWMTFREATAWVKRQVRAEGFQDATVHVGA